MHRVLLYYKYTTIENPELYTQEHMQFCKNLGVLGRILIAGEGINGTVSGTFEQSEKYMDFLHSDPRFADMIFKIDEVPGHVFKKLYVRYKQELVTFRLDKEIDPNKITGKHLKPKEFCEAMQKDDTIILDVRTDYEFDLGHFHNAVRPPVRSFREFPDWVRNEFSKYKDAKVLTYCTGGVRCEKFTGFLLSEGFKDVSQLDGGIITYSKDPEIKGKHFEGKCYMFDERISIPVNFADEYKIVSKCHHCGKPTDRYVNCANLDCHKQHFECEECERKMRRSCSVECMHAERHEIPA
ncbi:MAG: rhodanese-related sulfurtransferase [Ignavibacteriae bacterium]|nr:MAG: rhodanese-related sulfurtransferase [Ignavibacteriota bacterium]